MSFINRVINKLSHKSRLPLYEELIKYALEKGYRVVSLLEWYKTQDCDQKTLIMRHDVDLDSQGAYRMFKIEKRHNVTSSFYYRWSAMDSKSMKKISDNGHEVSLHYETLATYCRNRKIYSKDKVTSSVNDECLKILKREITDFQNRYWKIESICSHGDMRNRRIKLTNHTIIKDVSRSELGILFETYDSDIISKMDSYISDSSINNKHKWLHGETPIEAIDKGKKTICLLTHPTHWNYNFVNNVKVLFKTLIQNIMEAF